MLHAQIQFAEDVDTKMFVETLASALEIQAEMIEVIE